MFVEKLVTLLREDGCQVTFSEKRQGLWVIDENGGGWGYFLSIDNLAVTSAV
jgi:hypothetical protein